jgi:hypothetical protein
MFGATITATFLLLLMALSIILGIFAFIYAGYRFLIIVQQTAAGVNEIDWPTDPLLDKLPRAAYLAALLAICIVPAGFFLKLRPDVAIGGSPLLTFFVAAMCILWALFPILLFSALSASSPWIVFRAAVLRFFLLHFGATASFYVVSGLLGAGSFGLLFLAFARNSWLLTLATPFAAAAGFLIYARLLGRMAYLFDQSPGRKVRRAVPGTTASDPWAGPEESRRVRKSTRRKKSRRVDDPWAAPEEETRKKRKQKADRIKGYAIADNEVNPAAVEKPQSKPSRQVKGYRVSDDPLPAQPGELPQDGYLPVGYEPIPLKGEVGEEPGPLPAPGTDMISDFQRRYSLRAEENPPPARPLVSGVYSFPWYPSNVMVWLVMGGFGVAICSLIQICLSLKSQLGD